MPFKNTEPSPVDFKGANYRYTAPSDSQGNVGDLPCWRGPSEAISCWKFSWMDRWRLLLGGKLWFYCMAPGHPPISLSLVKPKIPERKE